MKWCSPLFGLLSSGGALVVVRVVIVDWAPIPGFPDGRDPVTQALLLQRHVAPLQTARGAHEALLQDEFHDQFRSPGLNLDLALHEPQFERRLPALREQGAFT